MTMKQTIASAVLALLLVGGLASPAQAARSGPVHMTCKTAPCLWTPPKGYVTNGPACPGSKIGRFCLPTYTGGVR